MQAATRAGLLPSQVVAPGLPWTRPGRPSHVDSLLIHAAAIFEAEIHERCGHPLDVCGDPEHEGRFHVEPRRCYATAATEEYFEKHKDALKGDSYGLTTRLLAEGETVADPLEFDPERARAAWAEQQRRYGLA